MANYTEHYQLHQWEPGDAFLRTDFNEDLEKIDAALKRLGDQTRHCTTGNYIGTGTYGVENVNRLDFNFQPKMVVIVADSTAVMKIGTIFLAGQTYSHGIGIITMSNVGLGITLSWTDRGVSWYSNAAERQLNQTGITYSYFAFG